MHGPAEIIILGEYPAISDYRSLPLRLFDHFRPAQTDRLYTLLYNALLRQKGGRV